MNIYVGNIPYSITEEALRDAFKEHGLVTSVKIIIDRITGNPKGFAFVDMPNKEEAEAAIAALNGKELGGRAIRVNQAEERRERPEHGGGSSSNGGGSRRDSYGPSSNNGGGRRFNNNFNNNNRY